MKDLLIANICFVIAIICALCIGCETMPDQIPIGDKTSPPYGYSLHCRDYPDSIFCKENNP